MKCVKDFQWLLSPPVSQRWEENWRESLCVWRTVNGFSNSTGHSGFVKQGTAKQQRGKQLLGNLLAPALGYKQNEGMFGEAQRACVEEENRDIDEKKGSILLGYREQRKSKWVEKVMQPNRTKSFGFDQILGLSG